MDHHPGLVHGFLPGRVAPDASVLLPRQVHGTRVVTAAPAHDPPEADAMVTAAPGTTVGVVTADCVPLLLGPLESASSPPCTPDGAARPRESSTARSRISTTCSASNPRRCEAAIGPAIGACCYEVGPEVQAAFRQVSGDATAIAWSRRGDRDVLDLRGAVRALLAAAGVRNVTVVGPCTRCSPAYCSYRRDGSSAGVR